MVFQMVCNSCKGKGKIIPNPCITCKGSGLTNKTEIEKIYINKGVNNGTKYSLNNKAKIIL